VSHRISTSQFRGLTCFVLAKIEDDSIPIPPNSVDIIISEPIGVLLVHERMLESFLIARDRYLKPDGAVFPNSGTIFLAPVCRS
jgi:histone-arginine methyltransferase CARM1